MLAIIAIIISSLSSSVKAKSHMLQAGAYTRYSISKRQYMKLFTYKTPFPEISYLGIHP